MPSRPRPRPRLLLSRTARWRPVDVTHPQSIRALLQKLDPWAVVNATGYVRVDDAEQDSDTCYGVNATGAVNVAAACQSHGVPLVTYSSDLVFDGSQYTPYTVHGMRGGTMRPRH